MIKKQLKTKGAVQAVRLKKVGVPILVPKPGLPDNKPDIYVPLPRPPSTEQEHQIDVPVPFPKLGIGDGIKRGIEDPPLDLPDLSPASQPTANGCVPCKWHYLWFDEFDEQKLNTLGQQGYELCAVVSRNRKEVWVFKRPIGCLEQ